jgi:hypothetical protein
MAHPGLFPQAKEHGSATFWQEQAADLIGGIWAGSKVHVKRCFALRLVGPRWTLLNAESALFYGREFEYGR